MAADTPTYDQALRQHQVVDQSDDVRDPADDSDEFNDPTEMAQTYPGTFDGSEREAAAAIEQHDLETDERHGGAIGVPASPNAPRSPSREDALDAAAPE